MKFLFIFNINPSNKILYCIPIKITMILIGIIATLFGILNFIGVFSWGGAQKDLYFYFIQSCGFLSPMILIYTTFKKDEISANIGYMFHTYYVLLINLMYVLVIIIFLIIDIKTLEKLKEGLIAQGIYNFFTIFANYIFFVFNHNYSELFEDHLSVNQSPVEGLISE
jgi:hypothetical protein